MEELLQTAVIIATSGRPEIVRALIDRLFSQTRTPDHIFVVGAKPEDVAALDVQSNKLTVSVGRRGLTLQRNDGLSMAGGHYDNIVFFDDDFIPSRYWIEHVNELFRSHPDAAAATGSILADGASTEGVDLADGVTLVEKRDALATSGESPDDKDAGFGGNIGCNMAFRSSALRGLAFDERLPAYAWLEDVDMLGQIARRGPVLRASSLWGVHMGHKLGRSRGVPLGYSQIANAVYLARKGTVPASHLALGAVKNLLSNGIRSFAPEPFVDRRGRLRGNLLALADLVRGRLSPERILAL